MHRKLFVLVGPPACGGGALLKEMQNRMNGASLVLGTGNRFREIMNDKEHRHHGDVAAFMPQGFLLPDVATINIFAELWDSHQEERKEVAHVWLDKVIRTANQAKVIIPYIRETWSPDEVCVVSINTPREVCEERIFKDRVGEGRVDDGDAEVVETRFYEWDINREPLLKALGKLARVVTFEATEMRDRDAPRILDALGILSTINMDGESKLLPQDLELAHERRIQNDLFEEGPAVHAS